MSNNSKTLRGRVEIRVDAPNVSSDGGLLLLEKVDERWGLTRRLAACLTDSRREKSVRHSALKMLRQRVYGICQGWEDCNDFDALRSDPLHTLVLGSPAAPQPTLSRFENGVDSRALYRLSLALARLFVERHRSSPPRRIVLDFDATDDPAHGQQEFECFHGHYGRHCFLPLLAFASCDGGPMELLAAVLRPGNSHAGRRSAAILGRLASMLGEAFPGAEVVFRADAGFALPEVYETCEDLGLSYLVSLPRNPRLESMSEPSMREARRLRDETGAKARVFSELSYAAASWKFERRVLVKSEAMDRGENPRFVVTNMRGDPEALYAAYCLRGDCENRIKELKLDLASGRTSCRRFAANAFRLLLHAAAFALMSLVRELLAETELARSTMGQIRVKALKIAAIVERRTRRILVRLPRGHPHAELIRSLAG